MRETLRGRPALNIPLRRIIRAVRRHRQVVAGARELRCSDGYIHKRFRQAGLTLAEVLESPSIEVLLNKVSPKDK
jgi:hypothetical protein